MADPAHEAPAEKAPGAEPHRPPDPDRGSRDHRPGPGPDHDPEKEEALSPDSTPRPASSSRLSSPSKHEEALGSDDISHRASSSSSPPTPIDGPEDAAAQPAAEQPAAAASETEPEASRTRLQTTLIMLSLCSTLFLAALDITIITTAVPTIANEFHSNLGYTWVGSAFILANGALVPVWGKVSDIWGRKPILLVATGVFWLGSLLCGVSVSMTMLIASRAVQGAGGGGIITLVNICISDLFSMRNRGFYFGLVGVVWAIASAIGPVLGGVFTAKVTWRWCFYINLPICGVAMVLMFLTLRLHNPRTPVRRGLLAVDWLGSVTIIGGTVMFLLGLEFGGVTHPWASPTVLCLILFGLATVGLFVVIEWKVARYPVIPLHLLRDRSNVASLLVAFFHSFVFLSGSYYLPLYFQGVQGLSSLRSGVFLLGYVLPLSAVSALIGFVIRATGNYKIGINVGLAVMTLGFGLFIDLDETSSLAKMVLYQFVAGIGVGPNFQSPLIALQAGVEGRDIASATSTFSFMRQIAGSISIVVGGAIFNNQMQEQEPALEKELGVDLADRLSGHNAAASVAMVGSLKGEEGDVARRAYAKALQMMYIVYVAFGAAGLISGLFIRQRKLSRQHTEHKTGLRTLRSREPKK